MRKKTVWNPATRSCKNGKYVGSIIDDSVIKCDEIIEETKAIPTKTFLTKTIPTKRSSTKTISKQVLRQKPF